MERKHDLTSVAIPAKLKPDAVPDSVTEHGYPLAQHYNLTVRRDVEFLEKMKMTEYEIIDGSSYMRKELSSVDVLPKKPSDTLYYGTIP